MPSTSTRDDRLVDEPPAPGATTVVEAPTAEAALERVNEELGADARIVDARRVVRGGIGGFFGTEHVQLHAAPGERFTRTPFGSPDASGDPAEVRETPPVPDIPDAAAASVRTSPVDRLLGDARPEDAPAEVDFATYLRSRLEDEALRGPSPTASADDRAGPRGSVDGEACATTTHGWSRPRLLRLGIPVALVHSLELPPDADDVAWTTAFAAAVRPLCRPLPSGPCVLVGPHAADLRDLLDVPAARSGLWLEALGAERWHHLVVGGSGWRSWLTDEVHAVSFARSEDLPDALRCAAELGLVLGGGPLRDRVRRASPLEVALAVREAVSNP